MCQIAETAAKLVMDWAEKCNPTLIPLLQCATKIIPDELHLGGTFWTAFTLVGDLNNGWNHHHIDKNNIVPLIITLGKDVCGGCTKYYDGGYNF
eukprot:5666643-Ditylum_brightwellii.AAC.1